MAIVLHQPGDTPRLGSDDTVGPSAGRAWVVVPVISRSDVEGDAGTLGGMAVSGSTSARALVSRPGPGVHRPWVIDATRAACRRR